MGARYHLVSQGLLTTSAPPQLSDRHRPAARLALSMAVRVRAASARAPAIRGRRAAVLWRMCVSSPIIAGRGGHVRLAECALPGPRGAARKAERRFGPGLPRPGPDRPVRLPPGTAEGVLGRRQRVGISRRGAVAEPRAGSTWWGLAGSVASRGAVPRAAALGAWRCGVVCGGFGRRFL